MSSVCRTTSGFSNSSAILRGVHLRGLSCPAGAPTGRFTGVISVKFLARQARLECRWALQPGFRDSGYRTAQGGAGKLYYVGHYGFSWSSTASGGDARYLGFNYGFLARMASKTPDGRGFQLRCLQEHPEGVLLAWRARKGGPTVCGPTSNESSALRPPPRGRFAAWAQRPRDARHRD